jgi:hypothetical protein
MAMAMIMTMTIKSTEEYKKKIITKELRMKQNLYMFKEKKEQKKKRSCDYNAVQYSTAQYSTVQ